MLEAIRGEGGRAAILEADLREPAAAPRLFDCVESQLGPVDILVNNATGWAPDSFAGNARTAVGHATAPVSAGSHEQVFGGTRAGALLSRVRAAPPGARRALGRSSNHSGGPLDSRARC